LEYGDPELKSLSPCDLKCEHLVEPRGLNDGQPRFTWALDGDGRDRRQSAYRIIVGRNAASVAAGQGELWDSGKIASSETLLIPYAGARLTSDQCVYWAVQAWDESDEASAVSSVSRFWTGLLVPSDWTAKWITRAWVSPEGFEPPSNTVYDNPWRSRPADYFRRDVETDRRPVRATLYLSALGVYEFQINGRRVGDDHLAPGWTDYHTRVEYQVHDVSDLVVAGRNTLGAIVGEGWYAGRVGMSPQKAGAHYGGRPVLIAQLHLEYADGSLVRIGTDETWKTSKEAIVYSDLLLGEKYDARLEQDGWNRPAFNDRTWERVEIWEATPNLPKLEAARLQPIRRLHEMRPRYVKSLASGEMVFDLGQNIAGHMRLSVKASAGSIFKLRHVELLTPEGDPYVDNLRDAIQTDVYIARGQGIEVFEPRFTYHGFQFVAISAPSGFGPSDLELVGIAVHSDTPLAGSFECGSPMVNQLFSNILWSQRDNFISVPTDCPQRNERLGWIADAQIFLKTAGYNMDVAAFFTKWMIDVADTETEGGFSDVAPSKPFHAYMPAPFRGSPAWGDGAVIVPWLVYLRYGDREILERHYASLVRWMDLIEQHNPDYLRKNYLHRDYGDWLSIGPATPRALVNTAYWGHVADLMGRIAGVLGRRKDQARYRATFEAIRMAFCNAFVGSDGRIAGDTQTAYLLALDFGLVDGELAAMAAAHLKRSIDEADGHLQTGFLGVKHLCPVLTDNGASERAYSLLLKETYPSWGFSIRQGATTIWERWDGWTPERGFQSANMNSFNHYAYGSVGEWLFARVAGIDYCEDQPGFRKVLMRPVFSAALGWCRATYRSHVGSIASDWAYRGSEVDWAIRIPANCRAQVILPDGFDAVRLNGEPATAERRFELGSGAHSLTLVSNRD